MKDINTTAAVLLAGGWTTEDKDELIREYQLTGDEAEEIIEEMKWLENGGKEKTHDRD